MKVFCFHAHLLLLFSLITYRVVILSAQEDATATTDNVKRLHLRYTPSPRYHHRMKNIQKGVPTILDSVRNDSTQLRMPSPIPSPSWIRDDGKWHPVPRPKYYNNPQTNYPYDLISSNIPPTNALTPYSSSPKKEGRRLPVISYHDPDAIKTNVIQSSYPPSSLVPSSLSLYPKYRRQQVMSDTQFLPSKKVCSGKKNLIDDFGIISLILSAFSTFIGFSLDLILSLKSSGAALLAKFFSLLFGLPSSLITALNVSNPFTYLLSNGLNVLSIATTLLGTGAGVSIGNLGLATDVVFEILGIYGLFLSVFSTFPELFDEVIDAAYLWGWGDEVKSFIEGYGCQNPYIST